MNSILAEKFQLTPQARHKMLLALAFAALIPLLLWIPGLQGLGQASVSLEWFVTLRSVLNIFFVVVGFSIFFIGWYSFHRQADAFHFALGITFLIVGSLDLFHFLTTPFMPPFLGANSLDKTTWFWIWARLSEVVGIYCALLVQRHPPKQTKPFASLLIAAGVLVGLTLTGLEPPALGVTSLLKWGFLLVILVMTGLNQVAYIRDFKEGGGEIRLFVLTSLLFSFYSVLCLTPHLDTPNVMGIIGLFYKGLAYLLLFRALVVTGIVTPYAQLETALNMYEQAHQQAQRDGLTGLFNHACFKEHLTRQFQEARRYERPLSLMMLDLDHFKRVNDTFGHPAGDEVLQAVANTVRGNIRDCDSAYRYGGEELALLLPETSQEQAALLAERLRKQIRNISAPDGSPISASFGVAQIERSDGCGEDFLLRTDQALYFAKQSGRDRVCCHREEQSNSILFSR